MKKYVLLLCLLLCYPAVIFSQSGIYNEDFSGASGTQMPTGWEASGSPDTELWRFDNPGSRTIMFPMTPPFAIFDAAFAGGAIRRQASLISPAFPAFSSNYILLMFDHSFQPGDGDNATVEVFDGTVWHEVLSWDEATENPRSEVLDLSAWIGGRQSAQIRFSWDGDGDGYWAVDNIRIYAARANDAAVLDIDGPAAPFTTGEHDVRVSIGNMSPDRLMYTTLSWEVNGIRMPDVNWSGDLPFGGVERNILLGQVNFPGPQTIRVWQSMPNGQTDSNSLNDEVVRVIRPALSGTYVIGPHSGDDFVDFSEAATALQAAGIAGPVTFEVKPGDYNNQIILNEIHGSSAANVIRFAAQNNDPQTTWLSFSDWLQSALHLKGITHLQFVNLGILGHNAVVLEGNSSSILFEGCRFLANDASILIKHGVSGITITDNDFQSSDYGIRIFGSAADAVSHVMIANNSFSDAKKGGIQIETADNVTIHGNTFMNIPVGISTTDLSNASLTNNRVFHTSAFTSENYGILLDRASQVSAHNNFIYTSGQAPSTGLSLRNADQCRVAFNTIHVTNTGTASDSRALHVLGGNDNQVVNNNLRVAQSGYPVHLEGTLQQLYMDYNNLFGVYGLVGRFNSDYHARLSDWQAATAGDNHSFAIDPFFTNPGSPGINQALLTRQALFLADITTDIDGDERGAEPTIGAIEYDICEIDAGINSILTPARSVNPGSHEVSVELQNQGIQTIHQVILRWSVNGIEQTAVPLSGITLEQGENMQISLGVYNFSGTFSYIRAWTSEPNAAEDCNEYNDAAERSVIARGELCGSYSLGGPGADFVSFSEAILALQTAGISCDVTFYVRAGVYNEQILIRQFPGSLGGHTITFEAETGNPEDVVMFFSQAGQTPLNIQDAQHIVFRSMSLNGHHAALIGGNSSNITIDDCILQSPYTPSTENWVLGISGNAENIHITGNIISGGHHGIRLSHTTEPATPVYIENNTFTAHASAAVYINGGGHVDIRANTFQNMARAVWASNASNVKISHNRMQLSAAPASLQNIGVDVRESSSFLIYNNTIHYAGTSGASAFGFSQMRNSEVYFNSIHMQNAAPGEAIRGIWLQRGNDNKLFNNIAYIEKNGYPIEILGSITAGTLNYNNYYSGNGIVGRYNLVSHRSIENWSQASSQDDNSRNEHPFFADDFSVNQMLLDGTANPVSTIAVDIYDQVRDAVNPDPGAVEFTPDCLFDAGINRIISPGSIVVPDENSTDGQTPIIVLLQNHGLEVLTELTIYATISSSDATTTIEYNWIGSLQPGEGMDVEIETYNFESGLYAVTVWTGLMNDCEPLNDKISAEVVASLAGDYYIGGEGADFANFSEAAVVLNMAGVSGHVRFFVREGVYEERFIIGHVPGAGPDSHVSFLPDENNTSEVLLEYLGESQAAITLSDAHYITFYNIGFTAHQAVLIEEGSSHITFEFSEFRVSNLAIQLKTAASDIDIFNNTFTRRNGARPDHFILMHWNLADPFRHIRIRNNVFSAPGFEAIHMFGVNDLLIEANVFDDIRKGILALEVTDLNINGNWFYIEASAGESNQGMHIEKGTNALIYNNFIRSRNQHVVSGIILQENTGNKVYFNTVNIVNAHSDAKCILLNASPDTEIKNNIFSTRNAGFPIYFMAMATGLSIDYNNYFSANGVVGYFGSAINSLTAWGTLVNGDAGSSFLDPLFLHLDNPLPQERQLNGTGIGNTGVTRDIYDALRNQQAPDIGCMEFAIDYGIAGLLSPGLNCELSDSEQVVVRLERPGEIPLENITLAIRINNGPVVRNTLDGVFDGFIDHTFDRLFDFSAGGSYEIEIWLDDIRDDNTTNDSRSYIRFVQPGPVSDFELSYYCDFVQVSPIWTAAPDMDAEFLWQLGDGTTSTEPAPIHSFDHTSEYPVSLYIESSAGCYAEILRYIDIQVAEEPLRLSIEAVDQFCVDQDDASIDFHVQGGIPPYEVLLNGEVQTISMTYTYAGMSPGLYHFEVTDFANCALDTIIEIREAQPFNPIIVFSDADIFAPAEITFSFSHNPERDVDSVYWKVDGQHASVQNPGFSFDVPGTYTISLTVFAGEGMYCNEYTETVFSVQLRPMAFAVELYQQYCAADDPSGIAILIEGGTPPYTVVLNDNEAIETNDTLLTFADLPPGSYSIVVADRFQELPPQAVDVEPPVIMAPVIFAESAFGISPIDIEFWFEAAHVQYVEWQYNGQISNDFRPSFRFLGEGEHVITLTVYSDDPSIAGHCAEYATFSVFTEQQVVMLVNEIFTPNGDGHQDYFEVFYKNLLAIDVDIYDRRGVMVYSYDVLDGRWDGNYSNGLEAPDGFYTYFITGTGLDNYIHEKTGLVQLIRETMTIYPNPTANVLYVDLKRKISSEVHVQVVDNMGNVLLGNRYYTYDEPLVLDVSALKDGLYILRVGAGAGYLHGKFQVVRDQ